LDFGRKRRKTGRKGLIEQGRRFPPPLVNPLPLPVRARKRKVFPRTPFQKKIPKEGMV
jgi:hypothetical protein